MCYNRYFIGHVTIMFYIETDGDLGIKCTAIQAFMKQKHRMIWERRHGPVGTGMKEEFAPI